MYPIKRLWYTKINKNDREVYSNSQDTTPYQDTYILHLKVHMFYLH